MKIFLDTARPAAVEKWAAKGIIDGVTTNPTHLSKESSSPLEVIESICQLIPAGDVSVEVTELEPQLMLEQARRIAKIASNVTVKIPCHANYYSVIRTLVEEDIAVNVTLVFSSLQALMMCKLGVKYVSPFIGRLNDIAVDGIQVLEEIRHMVDGYGYSTQVLAASLRTIRDFQEVLAIGADVATVPEGVLQKAVQHPLTDLGIKKFDADWTSLGIRTFP